MIELPRKLLLTGVMTFVAADTAAQARPSPPPRPRPDLAPTSPRPPHDLASISPRARLELASSSPRELASSSSHPRRDLRPRRSTSACWSRCSLSSRSPASRRTPTCVSTWSAGSRTPARRQCRPPRWSPPPSLRSIWCPPKALAASVPPLARGRSPWPHEPASGRSQTTARSRRASAAARHICTLLTLLCALALHAGFHDQELWPGATTARFAAGMVVLLPALQAL